MLLLERESSQWYIISPAPGLVPSVPTFCRFSTRKYSSPGSPFVQSFSTNRLVAICGMLYEVSSSVTTVGVIQPNCIRCQGSNAGGLKLSS